MSALYVARKKLLRRDTLAWRLDRALRGLDTIPYAGGDPPVCSRVLASALVKVLIPSTIELIVQELDGKGA